MSTPDTNTQRDKKRKRKVLLSTSVKKELVKVIHNTIDDEMRLFKKFREEAASPPPKYMPSEKKEQLRTYVSDAWEKESINNIVEELKTAYNFNASKSMVLDTLSTCANVAQWCTDPQVVEKKVMNTLNLYKQRVVSHLNTMQECKKNSSMEIKFMLQYWELLSGITVRNG